MEYLNTIEEDEYNIDFSHVKSIKRINDINEFYDIGKFVGKGTQGNVKEVRNKKLDMKLIIKIQSKKLIC